MTQKSENNISFSFRFTGFNVSEMPYSMNSPSLAIATRVEKLNLGEILIGDNTIPQEKIMEWKVIQKGPRIENARIIAFQLLHYPGSFEILLFLHENDEAKIENLIEELQVDEKIVNVISEMHDLDLVEVIRDTIKLTNLGKLVLAKIRPEY